MSCINITLGLVFYGILLSQRQKKTLSLIFFCFKFLFFIFIFLVFYASFDGLTNSAKKYSSLYGSSVLSSWYFMDFFHLQKSVFFRACHKYKKSTVGKTFKIFIFPALSILRQQKKFYKKKLVQKWRHNSLLYHNNLVQIKKAHKTSHKDKKYC